MKEMQMRRKHNWNWKKDIHLNWVLLLVGTIIPLLLLLFSHEGNITGAVISIIPSADCYESTVCTNETIISCVNEIAQRCETSCVNETKEVCADECKPQCGIEDVNEGVRETCITVCEPVCAAETVENCSPENCREVTEEKCDSKAVEKCHVETVCQENAADEPIVNKPINETPQINQSPVAFNKTPILMPDISENVSMGRTDKEFNLGIMAVPTHSTPILNTTNLASNNTNVNLTAYNVSTADIDNDIVKNIYNWVVNGTSIAVLNMPFEGINNTAGNNSWDYSGYGNNGSEQGGVLWNATGGYDGRGAYQFDGINDYIRIKADSSFDFDSSSTYSISLWMKLNDDPGYVISERGAGRHNIYLEFRSNGNLWWGVVNGSCSSGNNVVAATGDYRNAWHHVVGVYSSENMSIYVDGQLNASINPDCTSFVSSSDLYVGSTLGAELINGTIDDLMIFNRSLSTKQIWNLYANKTNEIASSETSVNDTWSVCITPNDGTQDGSERCSNNLTILEFINTPPTVNKPIITPSPAYANSTLTVNTTYNDVDDHVGTIYFKWYKNNTNIFNQTNASIASGTTLFATLDSNNFGRGDIINVTVQANDSLNLSNTNVSDTLTIQNAIPTHSIPSLRGRDYFNTSSADLTAFNQSTADVDNDIIKNIYNWNVNGTPIAVLNMPFEGINNTAGNNSWDYSGYGNNGSADSGDNIAIWNSTGGYDGKGAYEFNSTGYISLGAAEKYYPTNNQTFTFSLRFRIDKCSPNAGVNNMLGALNYEFSAGDGLGSACTLGYSDGTWTSLQPTVNVGTWNHFAASFNGSYWFNYLNGQPVTTGDRVGALVAGTSTTINLGKRNGAPLTNFFNGTIDEVMFFNRSLSAQQIWNLYANKTNWMSFNETAINDTWLVEITPNDGLKDGAALKSNNVTINRGFNLNDFSGGLVAYWTFDEKDRNSTKVFDLSNLGNNGSIYNFTPIPNNDYLTFDGVNDYIEIPSSLVFDSGEAGNMTFSMIFKSDNYSRKQVIISRRHPSNNEGHFNIYIQSNRVFFSFYSDLDAATKTFNSDEELRNGNAYQIFWVKRWNQTGSRLFINGVERNFTGDINTKGTTYTNLPVFIGAQNSGDSSNGPAQNFFNGTIEEIAIWNKILSIAEMTNFSRRTFDEISNSSFTIGNGSVSIMINGEGYMTSLTYNGTEKLSSKTPLSRITFNDSFLAVPRSFTNLGDNIYRIQHIDGPEITMSIIPKRNYIVFTIINLSGSTNNINEIDVFKVDLNYVPQENQAWAIAASSDEFFPYFLPIQVETICGESNSDYGCRASKWMGFANRSGALLTSSKSGRFDALQELIGEYSLPNVSWNGEWLRTSDKIRESYLFADVTNNNNLYLLNLAKTGNFKQLLVIDPLIYGHYDQPRTANFPNQSAFYSAMDKFIAGGIKIGIHTFINRVESGDSLYGPVSESLYKDYLGTLSGDISGSSATITLDNNLSQNSILTFYAADLTHFTTEDYDYVIMIGNELLECSSYSNNQLSGCSRGQYSTNSSSHTSGTNVSAVPFNFFGFFIDPNNAAAVNESTEAFAALLNRLNVSLLDLDGSSFTWTGMTGASVAGGAASEYRIKNGIIPYITKSDITPLVHTGDHPGQSYAQYYNFRNPSSDAVVLKNKEHTKYVKVSTILNQNPHGALPLYELGWWKMNGASFSDNFDFDSTSFDDIDYAMSKALVLNVAIGVQLYSFYTNHALLNETFALMGLYNALINEDIESNIVPQNIKDYLRPAAKEAVISNESGQWNLIEKKVSNHYAIWNSTKNYNYTLTNPFANQSLRMELRAGFDYYNFNDSRHLIIGNFSNASALTVTVSSSSVACSIDNDGNVSLNNTGSTTGQCNIALPGSGFVLTGKRGVGISITGDNKGEEVIINLVCGIAKRDFLFPVDFTGQKNISLGDPASAGDTLGTDGDSKFRHWDTEYPSCAPTVKILAAANTNYSLQFHELKALREKGTSLLVNPQITVNGNSITFPVNLSVNDSASYLIEYNGNNRIYKTYTTLYNRTSTSTISNDPITLVQGDNVINITSDISNSEYSARAKVKFFLFDDEDGDNIPTNGTYNLTNLPCNGSINFCDDNCPSISNPTQADSDVDGVGDACERTPSTGGASSSFGSSAAPSRETINVDLKSAQPVSVDFTKDLGVTAIELTSLTSLNSASLTVEQISASSSEVIAAGRPANDVGVYKYLRITSSVSNENIGQATIKFKVPFNWLSQVFDKNKVALYHFKDSWQKLPTEKIDEDSSYAYYESETKGFSLFAISTERFVEEEKVEPLPVFLDEETPEPEISEETSKESFMEKINIAGRAFYNQTAGNITSNIFWVILFAIIFLLFISAYVYKKIKAVSLKKLRTPILKNKYPWMKFHHVKKRETVARRPIHDTGKMSKSGHSFTPK